MREREYKQKLHAQLLQSGLSEKEISAIMSGEKVKKDKEDKDQKKEKEEKAVVAPPPPAPTAPPAHVHDERPTYTRMARRHLSLEALNQYGYDYQLDHVSFYPPASFLAGSSLLTNGAAFRIPTTSSSRDGCPSTSRTCCGATHASSASSDPAASWS